MGPRQLMGKPSLFFRRVGAGLQEERRARTFARAMKETLRIMDPTRDLPVIDELSPPGSTDRNPNTWCSPAPSDPTRWPGTRPIVSGEVGNVRRIPFNSVANATSSPWTRPIRFTLQPQGVSQLVFPSIEQTRTVRAVVAVIAPLVSVYDIVCKAIADYRMKKNFG